MRYTHSSFIALSSALVVLWCGSAISQAETHTAHAHSAKAKSEAKADTAQHEGHMTKGMHGKHETGKQAKQSSTKGTADTKQAKTLKAQTTCPVMGGAIDTSVYVDYKGTRVYFCCDGCKATFRKSPDKYMKVLKAELEEADAGKEAAEPEHKMDHKHTDMGK